MRLRFISVALLIGEVGGDPWAISRSLQCGRPAAISNLAQAFHDAGQRTNEAESAFNDAHRRFAAAWNRENGENPINDAAEVQRAIQSMGVQVGQLGAIAADLELIAAILAEAQRAAAGRTAALEGQLESVDRRLGEALDLERSSGISPSMRAGAGLLIDDLEREAIDEMTQAVKQIMDVRNQYADQLHRMMTRLRDQDGYDGAGVSGLGGAEPGLIEQDKYDVHAALAGDQAAARRVNGVLDSITAEQRAGHEPLTAEQASYLSQLQAQQHGMSIEALVSAEQRLGDQRQMVANSWQLMSNPMILFPRTDLRPGARTGSDTGKGGAAQLPASVQSELESRSLRSLWFAEGDPTMAIANIVRHGNPPFQTNTDLDRRLMQKASTIMDQVFDGHLLLPDMGVHSEMLRLAYSQIAGALLSAASPDHQVVHDTLTGPDKDAFLRNVTFHSWQDGGTAVAPLFSWTEAAAHGPEARIAGETAHAYSVYVGTHEPELLHLPGNHTLGNVNPGLVQAMAHGLAPYVSNIADVSGGVPEFGTSPDTAGDTESGKMPVAKGIFTVLSTDGAASDYFNGAADRQAIGAESAYAQALASHTPNMDRYNADLHDTMTLRGLVNAGIHNAVQADVENHQLAQTEAQGSEYTRRKTAYEVGIRTLSAAAAFIPGAGPIVGPAIGILGTAIENDVVGPSPVGQLPTEHPLPHMSLGQADREILNAIIASGHQVDIPPQYLINGRIGSPDELAGIDRRVTSGDYDQTLNEILRRIVSQGGTGTALLSDLNMIDRYDAITNDPNPQKR